MMVKRMMVLKTDAASRTTPTHKATDVYDNDSDHCSEARQDLLEKVPSHLAR